MFITSGLLLNHPGELRWFLDVSGHEKPQSTWISSEEIFSFYSRCSIPFYETGTYRFKISRDFPSSMDPLSWNLVRFVAPKRSLQTPADSEADHH